VQSKCGRHEDVWGCYGQLRRLQRPATAAQRSVEAADREQQCDDTCALSMHRVAITVKPTDSIYWAGSEQQGRSPTSAGKKGAAAVKASEHSSV
jgi:hypothetical protein